MTFELHPQLEKDTTLIGEFPLSLVLLHRDDSVPWVILVPKKANLTELHHLPMNEQQQFLIESEVVNQALESLFTPDKLNFGALGNMVPQLHVHHIARFKTDMAWPGPLWGSTKGEYRAPSIQQDLAQCISTQLSESPLFVAR
jgi:diadenosine tetraphosphate (Ap4A) HIT family hydrolase